MSETNSTTGVVDQDLGFTEEELLQGLKNPEDPAAQALLQRWLEKMEAVANAHPDPDVGRVVLEIQRATLYSKAGLHEYTNDAWGDAQMLAEATGRARLIDEVRRQAEAFHLKTDLVVTVTRQEFHELIQDFLKGLKQ